MKLFKRSTTMVALAALSSTAAYGAPSISGNMLSWPDDGWYQVQNADTYESLCQGGLSCEVPTGSYIVINLTTGERFENIKVNAGAGSPTVSGNIISWPDDGWYQVQRSDTYESLCQGGLSCKVSAGSYIVINHSTGSRFENVIVNDGGGEGVDVPAPANLHMTLYSASSGELMWDRAASSANISQYEIIRNGKVVGTTDGTSWFEGQIIIGDQFWEVVAIDDEGGRSEAARYPDSDSVDKLLSQAELMVDDIRLAFKLTELDEATAFGWRMANTARQLSQGIEPAEFQIGQTDVYNTDAELTGTNFDCDTGGFFAHVQGNYEEKPDGEANGICSGPEGSTCEIIVVANACVIDANHEISGNFRFDTSTGWSGTSSESVYLNDYQLITQDESGSNTVTMSSGGFELYDSPDLNISSANWSTRDLKVIGTDFTRTVEQQYLRATKQYLDDAFSDFTAWAFLPDTLFGGKTLFVGFTPEDYSPANGFAQIGQFKAVSGELDRRELIISNSSEQPDTWDLEITVNETVQQSTITDPQ